MTRFSIFFFTLTLLTIVSCTHSKENNSSEKSTAVDFPSNSAEEIFSVDSMQSLIYWFGSSPAGSHNGLIKISKGTLQFTNKNLVSGEIHADMRTIKNLDIQDAADRKDLEDHLVGEDFFNAAAFPYSVFKITHVENVSDSLFNVFVTGELTVRNATHPLKIKGTLTRSNDRVMISVPEFKIDRTEYGIMYQSKKILASLKDGFINDEIALSIKMTALKTK